MKRINTEKKKFFLRHILEIKWLLNRLQQRHKRTHPDMQKRPGLNLSLTHASHIQRLVTTVKSEHVAISAVANAVSRAAAAAGASRAPPIIPPRLICAELSRRVPVSWKFQIKRIEPSISTPVLQEWISIKTRALPPPPHVTLSHPPRNCVHQALSHGKLG